MTAVTIRDFLPADAPAFRRLNEEWIRRYFVLEPKDEEALADPEGTILRKGGQILMAEQDDQLLGCCALLSIAHAEFEIAKMAVTERARGTGIGRRLLTAAIERARALGATRLYLETNSSLGSAVHLYESLGFVHVPPERVKVSPYTRSNVHMELLLQ